MITRTLAVSFFFAALFAPAATHAGPSQFVKGEILVKFRNDTGAQHRAAVLAARGHARLSNLDHAWAHVRIRSGETAEAALAAYAADPAVEGAQPNFVYWASAVRVPNDPSYGQQWALKNTGQTISSALQPPGGYYGSNPGTAGNDIDIEPAWGVTTDCSGAIVAVLDTGVNYNHQDLAANMWTSGAYPNHGYDFISSDNDPMDQNGHGTHVAGIIGAAGNNALGSVGVCWKARIMALRVLDQYGSGSTASILAAINFAVANQAKVINMSLEGGGSFDTAYSNAITAAQNAGVLVVVAAGNHNNNNDVSAVYPCSFTHANVLCVAAVDQDYGRATFSNYGANSVDVGAPGTNILSTWPGTHAVTSEDYSGGGWFGSSTTGLSGGGWGIGSMEGSTFLAVPKDYTTSTTATYNAGTDDRAWKQFPTAGANVVTVDTQAFVDVNAGDWIRAACKAGGGDPFSGGVVLDENAAGAATFPNLAPLPIDMSVCASSTSTLGFQLQSRAASRNFGIAIAPFTVKMLTWNDSSYNTLPGTSMATPVVAGVAALLRSYNPAFTFADTKNAIIAGGRPVSSLTGITTSGKAVRAIGALANVKAPTGLTWVER